MAMSVVYTVVNGLILSENRGGVETEFVPDTLGSVWQTRDMNGNVTSTTEYWPYGEIQSQTGTNPSKFGFVGLLGYVTDMVNMLYVRARFYRPALTRWQTVDAFWPELEGYAYVGADPTQHFDQFGLQRKRSGPKYDPGFWNNPPIIDHNNCYSYACDQPSKGPKDKPQPGDRSGNLYDNFPGGKPSCNNIVANAKRDGYITDIPAGGCKGKSSKVCLYVGFPGGHADYHWYRQDDSGYWSDKPGITKATNCYPGSNIPIVDPTKDASQRGYPTKCGCFCAAGHR